MKSWVEISGARLGENLRAVQSAVGSQVDVLPVVKANAYGHDAVLTAPVLVNAGAKWLGVDDVDCTGEVCVTVPRLVPVLPAPAVDGCTDAVAGDAEWLAECDGGGVAPLFVAPWPFKLVSRTATTAATPHRASPAAARRKRENSALPRPASFITFWG